MTGKRCTDCKYTKGIGYDFWCGEGHTEYEVFGAETNCPYYEYHDWSKGVPSITAKRFTIDFDNRRIIDNRKNEYLVFLAQFKEVLNQLNDENEQLKQEINQLKHDLALYEEETAKELGIDWNE